jgi:hypothetical protein
VILSLSSAALANPFPPSQRKNFDGQTYQCFDFEGYKSLVITHQELEKTIDEVDLLEEKNQLLTDQVVNLQEIRKLNEEKIELFQTENERLYKLWQEENKKRHLAEERPTFNWLAWTAAGTFATSTLVLSLVLIAN